MDSQDQTCMEKAIEGMQHCVGEKSTDPKVAAVLITGSGVEEVAHRGQKAPGDHAEFTLLQKIVTSSELTAGGTLYTTLEPCTPDRTTRNHARSGLLKKE